MTPTISIIVPSFNQAEFLEETLQSIFSQDYPALDVRVIDGGSTDGSVTILERWAPRLAHWESERDRGQTHAINKGLAGMRGELWMYLNSDDLLAPGALRRVAALFADPAVQWVSAAADIWQHGRAVDRVAPRPAQSPADYLRPWARRGQFVFPFSGACFLRRSVYERFGGFDESFHFSMDMEYYTRLALQGGVPETRVPDVLARWRWHGATKTSNAGTSYGFLADEIRIAERYVSFLPAAEQAIVQRDLPAQRRWAAVGAALHPQKNDTPASARRRLWAAARRQPSLFFFRPWFGALRRAGRPHA